MSKCKCDSRTCDGSFPLLTDHFPDCKHFGPDLRELIENLVRGIEDWASQEDGIPTEMFGAYERAKAVLGEPVRSRL